MSMKRFPTLASLVVAGMLTVAGTGLGQQNVETSGNVGSSQNQPATPQPPQSNQAQDGSTSDATRENTTGNRTDNRPTEDGVNREEANREGRTVGEANRQQSDRNGGLGISVIDTDRGVRVRGVLIDSPADRAGIRPGDELVTVNSTNVGSTGELVRMISEQSPGTEVQVRLVRDGQEHTLQAQLESRREALGVERGTGQDNRLQATERFFRGEGSSPPWGSDDLHQHVRQLEQQVETLRQEVRTLRAMLDDDPSSQQFMQGQSRDSRNNQSRTDSQGDGNDARPDQRDRSGQQSDREDRSSRN